MTDENQEETKFNKLFETKSISDCEFKPQVIK